MATRGQGSQAMPRRTESGGTEEPRRRQVTTWASPEQQLRGGPSDLDLEATAAVDKFKRLIEQKSFSPWTRDVENARKAAQRVYIDMMLGMSPTPARQSIDDMWLKTTHYWINAYRAAAMRAQTALDNQSPSRNNRAFHDDLNKIQTLFRQGLKNEEVVYRTLISDLVKRWGLEKMVKTPLKAVGLKVKLDDAAADKSITISEKKEKIRLVSFALCSLGDMQRYRGQLKQQMGLAPAQATVSSVDGGYARAREYYDCAKAINPDDGSAYHQHAVLCSLTKDDLGSLYYMIRSTACKQKWAKGEEAVDNRMRRQLAIWKDMEGAREDGASSILPIEEEVKINFMAMLAVLSLADRDVHYSPLESQVEYELGECFQRRLLGAETIVQLTISLLGVHSQVRNDANLFRSRTASSKNRVNFEQLALGAVMRFFAVLLRIGRNELDERDLPAHHESAIVDDEQHLVRLISPILKRLLPAIRIASKWLKVNYDYLSRHRDSQVWETIQLFWYEYTTFLEHLVTTFPITQLPSITGPLEEDTDLRGFIPLARAIVTHGGRRGNDEYSEAHPDQSLDASEEHLMRISDILVEARLNMRNNLASKLQTNFDPDRLDVPVDDDTTDTFDTGIWQGNAHLVPDDDDDPVRMAFRAAIDNGDPLGLAAEGMPVRQQQGDYAAQEEEAEEEIVFRPRNAQLGGQPARVSRTVNALQQVTRGMSQASITDQRQAPAPTLPQPQPRNEGSPQGLFGPSMWSLSREESQNGIRRSTSQSGQMRADPQFQPPGLDFSPSPQAFANTGTSPAWPPALPFVDPLGGTQPLGGPRQGFSQDQHQRLQREFSAAQAAFNAYHAPTQSPTLRTPDYPAQQHDRNFR